MALYKHNESNSLDTGREELSMTLYTQCGSEFETDRLETPDLAQEARVETDGRKEREYINGKK